MTFYKDIYNSERRRHIGYDMGAPYYFITPDTKKYKMTKNIIYYKSPLDGWRKVTPQQLSDIFHDFYMINYNAWRNNHIEYNAAQLIYYFYNNHVKNISLSCFFQIVLVNPCYVLKDWQAIEKDKTLDNIYKGVYV